MFRTVTNLRLLPALCPQFAIRIVSCLMATAFIGFSFGVLATPAKHSEIKLPHHHHTTVSRVKFILAERALREGAHKKFRRLQLGLQDYPLHPYLVDAHFRRYLNSATENDFKAAQEVLAETPLAKRLLAQWLRSLAAKRNWATFLSHYHESSSAELSCWYARALLAQGLKKKAFAAAEPLWLVSHSQHRACNPVFSAWRAAGMPSELVISRFKLALDARNRRLVRYLHRFLPAEARALAEVWLALADRPNEVMRYARRRLDGLDEVFTTTIKRLGYRDPDRAMALWQKLTDARSSISPELLSAHFGAVLFRRQRHVEAERWLDVPPQDRKSERAVAIRIFNQIALNRWLRARTMIDKLPMELRSTEQWRYWLGRSAAALGDIETAHNLWARLAKERSYYGYLAADKMHAPYRFNHQPIISEGGSLKRMEATEGFQRAAELKALGRETAFRREWRFLERQNPERLELLAVLARDKGWDSTGILSLARSGRLDALDIRFPILYELPLRRLAGKFALNVQWLLATVRQESAFIVDARSHAGAIGLMQIMPTTGRRLARRFGIKDFKVKQLTDPLLNIELGARYLRILTDKFRHPLVASAAYNAGPQRVRRWLPRTTMSADLWVETIPWKETRDYVKRIAYYQIIYAHRLGEPSQRLTQVFAKIRGGQM